MIRGARVADRFMRRQVGALRRRARWWVLGCIGGLIGAFVTTLSMHPIRVTDHYFKATETRVVTGLQTEPAFPGAFSLPDMPALMQRIETVGRINSRADLTKVASSAQIGVFPNTVTATVDIVAVADDSDDAVKLATAAAATLSEMATDESIARYDRTKSRLEAEFSVIKRRNDDLVRRIAAAPPDADLLRKQLEYVNGRYTDLESQLQQLAAFVPFHLDIFRRPQAIEINAGAFSQRMYSNAQMSIGSATDAVPDITTNSTTETTLPGTPVDETALPTTEYPDKTSPLLLGGIAGLVVGAFAALLADVWDDRIRNRASVEEITNKPVIAEIPRFRRREHRSLGRPGTSAFGQLVAAMLPVRSALFHQYGLQVGRPGGAEAVVLLVSSPVAREGRTTVTMGLAGALADSGLRTLVVDGDLRHPTISRHLGAIPNLVDPSKPMTTRLEGVDCLGAPRRHHTLAAAIDSVRLNVDAERENYDVILLDAAPMLVTNDVIDYLVSSADVIVAVWRVGETRIDAARRMLDISDRLDIPTLGVVLNAVDSMEIDQWLGGAPLETLTLSETAAHGVAASASRGEG